MPLNGDVSEHEVFESVNPTSTNQSTPSKILSRSLKKEGTRNTWLSILHPCELNLLKYIRQKLSVDKQSHFTATTFVVFHAINKAIITSREIDNKVIISTINTIRTPLCITLKNVNKETSFLVRNEFLTKEQSEKNKKTVYFFPADTKRFTDFLLEYEEDRTSGMEEEIGRQLDELEKYKLSNSDWIINFESNVEAFVHMRNTGYYDLLISYLYNHREEVKTVILLLANESNVNELLSHFDRYENHRKKIATSLQNKTILVLYFLKNTENLIKLLKKLNLVDNTGKLKKKLDNYENPIISNNSKDAMVAFYRLQNNKFLSSCYVYSKIKFEDILKWIKNKEDINLGSGWAVIGGEAPRQKEFSAGYFFKSIKGDASPEVEFFSKVLLSLIKEDYWEKIEKFNTVE